MAPMSLLFLIYQGKLKVPPGCRIKKTIKKIK